MKKVLLGFFLLSSIAFGRVQYKYIKSYKATNINKVLKKLKDSGADIIDIHLTQEPSKYINGCFIVYDDSKGGLR